VSVPTAAPTRVNLEIIGDSGEITEILEPGGRPAPGEGREFLQQCTREIVSAEGNGLLVISGRLPAGVPPTLYASLINTARAAGIETFVDSSGEALRVSVEAKARFVKVNRQEAEELLGRTIATVSEVVAAGHEIIRRGAATAAITLGSEGLIWIESANGPVWKAQPPKLPVISAVGSGDATLAGFARAATQRITGEPAIRLATACGAANLSAPAPARIDFATVQSLLPQIAVERL
jgi:1-phosphofructokinase family hexose kinase